MQKNPLTPEVLYKVLSLENWEKSQTATHLYLAPLDDVFIHFATKEQLQKVIDKFWEGTPSFLILKINAALLEGKLVFEANPGGSNKYYHLYHGKIPLSAVINAEIVTSEK